MNNQELEQICSGDKFIMILNPNDKLIIDVVDKEKRAPNIILEINDKNEEMVMRTGIDNIQEFLKSLRDDDKYLFIENIPCESNLDCDLCSPSKKTKWRYDNNSRSREFPVTVCRRCSEKLRKDIKKCLDKYGPEIMSYKI